VNKIIHKFDKANVVNLGKLHVSCKQSCMFDTVSLHQWFQTNSNCFEGHMRIVK